MNGLSLIPVVLKLRIIWENEANNVAADVQAHFVARQLASGHGIDNAWWRHQMETFSALLALCVGNSPVNFPHKGQWREALVFS